VERKSPRTNMRMSITTSALLFRRGWMKSSLQLFVALFLLTLVGMKAQAREVNVVTISNDETKFQYNLILETNDKTGDILKFHKDKFDPARKATRLGLET